METLNPVMMPWLETMGVIALALIGAGLGHLASRLRPAVWVFAETLPFVMVAMIGLSRRFEALNFVAPFSWVMEGRREFVMLAVAGTILLVGATGLLADQRQRKLIRVLAFVAVCNFALLPFIQPAVIQRGLSRAPTRLDANGICRQQYSYTCGPAAAVTALRYLDLPASEGELAILAHTSPIAGTAPDSLASALRKRYGEAIDCQYRYFTSIDDMKAEGVVLATISAGPLNDHFIAVLHIASDSVTLGDPEEGLRIVTKREFEEMWRNSGVVIRRKPTAVLTGGEEVSPPPAAAAEPTAG
jgi:predicted double-glycine peptidase